MNQTPRFAVASGRSLRQSALSSSAWTITGAVVSQIIRLGGNVILAALLFQEAFALMAVVAAVSAGLQMFSDIGLTPSVVQNKRGDEAEFLNTAWSLQVIRGLVLAIIACAIAWPMAWFFAANDPMAWELRWLIPLMATGMLISGFQSSNVMSAIRHMNLAGVTTMEVVSQSVGLVVMIAVAWVTGSVYALVLGGVVGGATSCALSYLIIPGQRNRFSFDRKAVWAIVHYGKWIFISTVICFVALQMDRLVFARLFPLDQVGVYAIAASIAVLAPTLLGRLQHVIVFPLFSRTLANNEPLPKTFGHTKTPMIIIGAYIVALLIAGAQSFVDLAYDPRYTMAGLFIPILACGAWFATVEGIYGAAFLAIGKPQIPAIALAVKVVVFAVLLVPAIEFAGFIGAVVAFAASDAFRMMVAIVLARRIGLRDQRSDAIYTAYALAVGFSVLGITKHWAPFAETSPILQLIAQATLVTSLFAPMLFIAYRQIQRESGREN